MKEFLIICLLILVALVVVVMLGAINDSVTNSIIVQPTAVPLYNPNNPFSYGTQTP